MRILITGACDFVGSTLARSLFEATPGVEITGVDSFIRPGSETNREPLERIGVRIVRGDIRDASTFAALPRVDWVIDAAANSSGLAGVDGKMSSREVVDHNLLGSVNMLEFCKAHGTGFILLSASRVYSIPPLASLPVVVRDGAFAPDASAALPAGLSPAGANERYSTSSPISHYGVTKLASERLALEYGEAFGFPVWVNRCGVLAGAGQFGRADQGIFSYWIHSWARRCPLKYIGFVGTGHQVRDCLHPRGLFGLSREAVCRRGRTARRQCFRRRPDHVASATQRLVRGAARRARCLVGREAARFRHPMDGAGHFARTKSVEMGAC